MSRVNIRRIDIWRDIAFTALPPGWVNVYELDDGAHMTTPCPGLLLQEATHYEECWDEDEDGVTALRTRRRQMERETRTVAADIGDGDVSPASECSNYVTTCTAEGWDAHLSEEAAK